MRLHQVNWFQILADLKRLGVSSYDLSERLDVSHTTVLRWGQGSEPRYQDGERLIALWLTMTGRELRDVPRIRLFAAI